MRKFLIIIFLLFAPPVFGATQQVLMTSGDFSLNATTTLYNVLYGIGNNCDWNADETISRVVFPAAGTLKNLRIILDGDPDLGAGTQSYTFQVYKNGSVPSGTLTCAISSGATSCNDMENSVTVAANDTLSIESVPANTPTVRKARWVTTWNPTITDQSILIGGSESNTLATSGTEYLSPAGASAPDPTEFDRTILSPTNGVFKNFYVILGTAPGAGTSRTFAFRDSASAETINCTISDTETSCNSTLETETATATPAEKFVIVSTVSGTPAASVVKYGIVFDPRTEGEFIIAQSNDDDLHTSATEYLQLITGDAGWNATESLKYTLMYTGNFPVDMIIKNMYVELETDPGAASEIFTFTLRNNAGNASGLLQSVCAGVQTCNDTENVVIADGDLMDTESIPTSLPAVGSAAISYTGFIPPSITTTIYNGTVNNATLN